MVVHRDVPDELRCVHIKFTGQRCKVPRSEDGGERCAFHARMLEENTARRVLARDMPDVDPLDALRELMKMGVVMCRRIEIEMLDNDVPDLFTFLETESRVGGPGGGYDMTRLTDTQRALVLAYRAERAELRAVTQLAIAQGLAEREQKLHEAEIGMVLQVLMTFAQQAGLDAESREIRELMITALRAVSGEREIMELGR